METHAASGLSSAEAAARLAKYGPNDVHEKRSGLLRKLLSPLVSPISLMLLGASALSFYDDRIFDGWFILVLYALNYGIEKWQEFKADRAIAELQKRLAFDVRVQRDSAWTNVPATALVPGDLIRLGLGSIIPADATVIRDGNLSVNEAVLTGESLPKEKHAGDTIFSGSYITTGSVSALITATGPRTSFGKTIFSIEQSAEKSILEKDILSITRFLTGVSLVAVALLTVALSLRGFPLSELITLDLSLVIAGIPIALPAVMTIILSIGAAGLAQKQVIVRRLSALQDLANVDLLLTDKTGTLTKNTITIARVAAYRAYLSDGALIALARAASSSDTPDAIETAIRTRFEESGEAFPGEVVRFTPFDSERKRSTALLETAQGHLLVSMGAPQVILGLDGESDAATRGRFERDVAAAARDGFRILALATKHGDTEEHMMLAGLLYLADPLDETSAETLAFMRENGIAGKMVTGDNRAIAERIAHELGLTGRILPASDARALFVAPARIDDGISVFAEILPKDKYELVRHYRTCAVVASTGDGINDLPALKAANVGIAVSGAVSALKSLADIVLLGSGIAVIKDAIIEARKIFVRLYDYSVYRISESFRLIITILILGLWIGSYPLQPLQLILLAFLNDIPIVTLAFDRVKIAPEPSAIRAKERLVLSTLFGSVGVLNSVLLFLIMRALHFPLPLIQTIFFLKLTVSGHMLIFVAHTAERWWRFLPATPIIIATGTTQVLATILAITGFLMPASIPLWMALLVWAWAFFWMQVSEAMKDAQHALLRNS